MIAVERGVKFGGVAVYSLDQESIDIGRARYKKSLLKYKYHISNPGVYPGYSPEVESIGVSQWVISQAAFGEFDS
jgi:hypothetical protein